MIYRLLLFAASVVGTCLVAGLALQWNASRSGAYVPPVTAASSAPYVNTNTPCEQALVDNDYRGGSEGARAARARGIRDSPLCRPVVQRGAIDPNQ